MVFSFRFPMLNALKFNIVTRYSKFRYHQDLLREGEMYNDTFITCTQGHLRYCHDTDMGDGYFSRVTCCLFSILSVLFNLANYVQWYRFPFLKTCSELLRAKTTGPYHQQHLFPHTNTKVNINTIICLHTCNYSNTFTIINTYINTNTRIHDYT